MNTVLTKDVSRWIQNRFTEKSVFPAANNARIIRRAIMSMVAAAAAAIDPSKSVARLSALMDAPMLFYSSFMSSSLLLAL